MPSVAALVGGIVAANGVGDCWQAAARSAHTMYFQAGMTLLGAEL
jgi:hypothetical protein